MSTPPWWEVWASLAAWVALGVMIFRLVVVMPAPLNAVDTALMTVAYLGVGVELFYELARRTR